MSLPNAMGDRFDASALGGVRLDRVSVEASNARVASLQLLDREGREMTSRAGVFGYIASDATGDTLEPHSATLTIAASTDGFIVPNAAANVAGHCAFFGVSEADGDLDISITQTSGVDTFYVVIVLPNGELWVSAPITFA